MTGKRGDFGLTLGRRPVGHPTRVARSMIAAACVVLAILVASSVVIWWTTPIGRGVLARGLLGSEPIVRPSPLASPMSQPGPSTEGLIPLGRLGIRVPILEYHYIRVDTHDRLGFNLSVTPSNFVAQMTWLANHGYHPINFADLRAYFLGRAPLPARPVVLTFDDGYLDFYTTAFPVLQALGFKAVSYIVSGFLDRDAYMTGEELLQLDRSGLVEIGSHTVEHVNLAKSTPVELAFELQASRSSLEKLLGHSVVDFCYPSGDFNSAAVAAVSTAGYITATTEMPGTELAWSTRLIWPRVRVAGGETLQTFIANLGQPEPWITQTISPSPTPIAGNPTG